MRRHFSKIRKNKDYQPSKNTAILAALALKLDLDETSELLESAGFSLSHSDKFDIVVEYFISKKIYDLILINEILDYEELPLLSKYE